MQAPTPPSTVPRRIPIRRTRWPARRPPPRLDVYQTSACSSARGAIALLGESAHRLKGAPHVVDIRNIGLLAGSPQGARRCARRAGVECANRCYETAC